MEPKRLHLLYLSEINKKLLLRELLKWCLNSKLKSNDFEQFSQLANRNRESLRNSIRKTNSGAQGRISTIFESNQERTPSPPMNIFEELKSSLNKKVVKVENPNLVPKPDPRTIKSPKNFPLTKQNPTNVESHRSTPTLKTIKKLSSSINNHYSEKKTPNLLKHSIKKP